MPADPQAEAAFERGRKEGLDDATLAAHTEHLRAINGSVDEMVKALTAAEKAIRDGDAELAAAIREVASDVRTLNEEQKTRDVARESARKTLAAETKRRRDALEAGGRTFTRWREIVATLIALLAVSVAIYFGVR